ncbi:hypothetical protein LH51_18920 [Nitrincola sp. A-D6]|nr:hypothetical protein LH51_18920 [Nitrincola sp. A-D6]
MYRDGGIGGVIYSADALGGLAGLCWIAVILMNAVIALPFVFQQLRPAVSDYDASYTRLLADLNLTRLTHWRCVYLPYLKPLLRRVLAISFVLALGDMSVFAIFGSDDWRTLLG